MDRKNDRLTAQKSNSPRAKSIRAARTAGMATAMAGALVTGITAPQVLAEASTPVLLSASDGSLQPIIDQILAEQQAAVTANGSLPLTTPGSIELLPAAQQMAAWSMALRIIYEQNSGQSLSESAPFMTSAPASDTVSIYGDPLPDNIYRGGFLAPGATYEMSGTVGAGTEDINITPLNKTPVLNGALGPDLELGHNLQVNPDGTYTVTIGPTAPSGGGNYIDDSDFNSILTRVTMGNWALGPGDFNLQCVADCPLPTPGVSDTGLSNDAISSLLTTIAKSFSASNAFNMFVAQIEEPDIPANSFTSISTNAAQSVGGMPNQLVSWGNFNLQPDQALIVKVPDIASGYSSIQLNNPYGQALGWTLEQTSLNNTQAFHNSDGFTYYVLSGDNPGVANWVDTMGLEKAQIYLRWQNLPSGSGANYPTTVSTEVVPVDDVIKYLPTDTPTVSPEEFAADMNERVLGYGYALDSSKNASWLAQELWMHDLQTAMGSDNYEAVFGAQDVTPMWLRLTPALSPDMLTVVKDILTDPVGSWTVIQENLALAVKDISLPVQLAQALLQHALAGDGQSLGAVLSEVLFDPNTSITAGILNARDDLATAIMAATKNGFPTELGPIATWEWEHMSELTQMTPATMLQDLSSLFNFGDWLGG